MFCACAPQLCGRNWSHFLLSPFLPTPFATVLHSFKRSYSCGGESSGSREGLEELEEEITCPVCQEHFRDPKILPCLHYYCKECVRQLALRAGANSPFACPECRRETVLPQNDPDQLPTDFFVNRMKELRTKMGKAHGKMEAICGMCSRAKAEAFCRQCTEFICNDCVKIKLHGILKVFAGHKVVALQELKEGGAMAIPLKEAPPPMCKDHDEQLKIYCFDCNHLICRDCVISGHAGHKIDFVKKSAPQYKKTLKQSLVPLAKIKTNISVATREVEKVEIKVSEQNKAVAGTIEQSFKQLYEILRKREKQLLDRASELKQQKLDNLGSQKKGFALATSEIQGLVDYSTVLKMQLMKNSCHCSSTFKSKSKSSVKSMSTLIS